MTYIKLHLYLSKGYKKYVDVSKTLPVHGDEINYKLLSYLWGITNLNQLWCIMSFAQLDYINRMVSNMLHSYNHFVCNASRKMYTKTACFV